MNNIKNIIKNNKKILIITTIMTIIINLISNYNFIITIFNKTKPITYQQEAILIDEYEYIIKDINKPINLIEIEFETKSNNLKISYTDNNFKYFDHFNKQYNNNNINKDKLYIKCTNNKIKDLKINLDNGKISKITINPKIKYNLNIILSATIFISTILIYNLLSKTNKLNFNNYNHKYIIISIIICLITLCTCYCIMHSITKYQFGDMYEKYYVDAIIDGRLNLDYPIDESLLNSKNPYDPSNRFFSYLWDSSFYKGKYYCYFGILPAITILVPFKIITNHYLSSPIGCLIYAILGIIGTYLLYKEIIKKYFKNISIQTYTISFIYIILGSKILWCMHRPNFYELVSLAAYTHIIFGLYLTLFKDKKIHNFIGYTLLASSVLCRPTALFSSILILPKIINNIKNKKFKTIDYIILIVPYILVGLFTMYINYIRFDSIFEFGIKYQLSTNNLYNQTFSLSNIIYGTYNYLFNNINISLIPFNITSIKNNIPFITDFNIENIGGGIIPTSILGIIILFIPKIFKNIKEKELKLYIIISLLLASSLILLSTNIGALIGRYMLDFNYIFYFITVILSLTIINNSKYKNTKNIYIILCILSITINLLLSATNN